MKTETMVILGVLAYIVYDSWQKAADTPTAPSGPADPLGKACFTGDGASGTFQRTWNGTLVCVPDNLAF